LPVRPGGSEESFEDAVRVAASVIAAGVDQHFPTQPRPTGGIDASVDQTGLGYTNVLDKLVTVEMSKDDPGLPALGKMTARGSTGSPSGS
jgi:hypothetical protein